MSPDPGRFRRLLKRALLLRCPLCGQGKIFRNLLVRHAGCGVCGLPFEREQGYFVGGMEVHWITVYVLGVIGYFWARPILPDDRELSLAVYMPCVLAASVLVYRHTRSLWMLIDNWLDPVDREYIDLARKVAEGPRPGTRDVRESPEAGRPAA